MTKFFGMDVIVSDALQPSGWIMMTRKPDGTLEAVDQSARVAVVTLMVSREIAEKFEFLPKVKS